MMIIFPKKSIIITKPNLQENKYELNFIIHPNLFVKLFFDICWRKGCEEGRSDDYIANLMDTVGIVNHINKV